MLFMAFQSYTQSRPYFPTFNLSSAFFASFPSLRLIFYVKVPKYLNSVTFLAGSTFLSAVSSLIYELYCIGTPLSTSVLLDISAIGGFLPFC
jgi:hypothetical protein